MRSIVLIFTLSIIALPVNAGSIFKCVNEDGSVRFTDKNVCEEPQQYSAPEPVLKALIHDEATVKDAGLISLNFDGVEIESVFNLLAEFAGLPLVTIIPSDANVSVHYENLPWHQVFDDVVAKNNLAYRKAYQRVYLYESGSVGELIVNTPDLLRWYQSDKSWKVAVEQDNAMKQNPRYDGATLADRLPVLIPKVKEALGEPLSSNQAEYTGITDSYKPYFGETSWEVNKRYLDDLQEERHQKEAVKAQQQYLESKAAEERRERRRARRLNCTTTHSGSSSYTNCF